MAIQVIRNENYTKGSLRILGKELKHDPNYQWKNNVCRENTYRNIWFKETAEKDLYQTWKKYVDEKVEIVRNYKANEKVWGELLITSGREFFVNMTTEEIERWAKESYEWACREVGGDNILEAVCHMDETTPHLQIAYVPKVDYAVRKLYELDANGKILRKPAHNGKQGSPVYKRDGEGKIVTRISEGTRISKDQFWKNKGGSKSYSHLQDSYQEAIGKRWGLERGEIGSTKEHRQTQQYCHGENKKVLQRQAIQIKSNEQQIERQRKFIDNQKKGQLETLMALNKNIVNEKQKLMETETILKKLQGEEMHVQYILDIAKDNQQMSEIQNQILENELKEKEKTLSKLDLSLLEIEEVVEKASPGIMKLKRLLEWIEKSTPLLTKLCALLCRTGHKKEALELTEISTELLEEGNNIGIYEEELSKADQIIKKVGNRKKGRGGR